MSATQKKNVNGAGGAGKKSRSFRRNNAPQDAFEAPPAEDPSKIPIFRLRKDSGAANDYTRTKKRLVEYVDRTQSLLSCIVEDLEEPQNEPPEEPDDAKDKIEMVKFEAANKRYEDRQEKIADEKKKLFGVLMGTLSAESLAEVETHADFKTLKKDPLKLMKIIEATHLLGCIGATRAEREAIKASYNDIQQGEKERDIWFRRRILAEVDRYNNVMKMEKCPEQDDEDVAYKFVTRLNSSHAGYKLSRENYPKDMPKTIGDAMIEIRTFRETDVSKLPGVDTLVRNAYVAGKAEVSGKSSSRANDKCKKCGKKGHWARDCRSKKPTVDDSTPAAQPQSNSKLPDSLKKQLKGMKLEQMKQVANMVSQLQANAEDDAASDYGSDQDD
jgi:hypothetical protein|mmetsp:Transcript_19602/g.32773  ORF Transcript_19602/g.32773 Transcript_19602/m.32773 type:complete len:386 (+) Transcript_19602:2434-3591(+)